ncbi:MAG: transglycosylase SLT domain-containing protein [Gemmatimonadetes bacterium]|nr:transglycosylase SLT domain-containing protein [Gemmatimonadota bacterium]
MPRLPHGIRARPASLAALSVLAALAVGACAPAIAPLPPVAPAQAPARGASPGAREPARQGGAQPGGQGKGDAAPPTPRASAPAAKGAGATGADGAGTTATPQDPATPDEVATTAARVFGAEGDGPRWDIDVRSYETHDRVEHYVALFSGTARANFSRRLSRGTRYEPMIRGKLRAKGMPEDLTYLALIESGYDPHAYSRAAAVGMWQFMSSTARGVGLRVDWWMDERRDPARATDAAITFLGYLTRQFGSLYLAAAAYNGGPGRVARGLTRFAEQMEGSEGEDRFFALAEQDYLRNETKDYVPQLIAAALLAKMPERYGFAVESLPPYGYDSVRVEAGTSLAAVAEAAGVTPAELRDLNPALLRGITPPDAAVWVRLPVGSAAQAEMGMAAFPAEATRGYRTVTVKGSATTPGALAEREGVTLAQLRQFNPGMKTARKGRLVAGQRLRIPVEAVVGLARDVPDPGIERYGRSSAALSRGGVHVVKRGETLGGIARRYNTTVPRLQALNRLQGTRVIAGQTLRVRGNVPAASSASAKKPAAKKPATRKASPKKAPAKKAPAKKPPGKKPPAKKAPAKKPGAR